MRKPSRLEALSVLRGERDYWNTRGSIYQPAVYALQLAMDILNGKAAPSGCEYESEPPHLKKKKKVDFIGGLLE